MISIIVPVYKSENTIVRCVESLVNQTEQDYEVLLVVDGPPDRSGIMCEELAEKYDKVRVIHQENQGVSKARNHGIREAKGEWIRFVDSDDYVDCDSNEILLKAATAQDADLVIAGYHHLYFGRDILKCPKSFTYDLRGMSESDGKTFVDLYIQGYLNMPWNKLYKKSLMEDGFPTDLNLGEDLLFNEGCIKRARRVVVVDAPVCNYIQDDRGTTLSTKKRMDKIPIALRLFEASTVFFRDLSMDDCNAPATKVAMEFLDDVENLAFDETMSRQEKLSTIELYAKQLSCLHGKEKRVNLNLLDYKMIYPFLLGQNTRMVYFLVVCRGALVKLLKKRG